MSTVQEREVAGSPLRSAPEGRLLWALLIASPAVILQNVIPPAGLDWRVARLLLGVLLMLLGCWSSAVTTVGTARHLVIS